MLSVLSVCSSSSPNFCPPSHLTCPSGRTTCLWRTFVSRPSEREFPCARGFPQKPLPVTSVRSFRNSFLVDVSPRLVVKTVCIVFLFVLVPFFLFVSFFICFCAFCFVLFFLSIFVLLLFNAGEKAEKLSGRCATFRSMM